MTIKYTNDEESGTSHDNGAVSNHPMASAPIEDPDYIPIASATLVDDSNPNTMSTNMNNSGAAEPDIPLVYAANYPQATATTTSMSGGTYVPTTSASATATTGSVAVVTGPPQPPRIAVVTGPPQPPSSSNYNSNPQQPLTVVTSSHHNTTTATMTNNNNNNNFNRRPQQQGLNCFGISAIVCGIICCICCILPLIIGLITWFVVGEEIATQFEDLDDDAFQNLFQDDDFFNDDKF